MPPNTSSYIWLNKIALGEIENVPMGDLLPTVLTPLSTDELSWQLSSLKSHRSIRQSWNNANDRCPVFSKPSIFIYLSKQVPTTHSSSINTDQAKVLTSFVSFLNASGKCCTVHTKNILTKTMSESYS